ncbi:MAG: hypothetical protein ACLGSD_00320 [Acidobacteriota bacterium]
MKTSKKNLLLAERCVNSGNKDPNQLTVADAVRAFEEVVGSEPGSYKGWARVTMLQIRKSAAAICQSLGERRVPIETKACDNTLIVEIIGADRNLGYQRAGTVITSIGVKHSGALELILACGRAMGLSHPSFQALDEWDRLKFTKMDNQAKRVKLALKRSGIRPRDVTEAHLESWANVCEGRGLTGQAIRASISQFKLAIRESHLESEFPSLDVQPKRPMPTCVGIDEMHPLAAEQLHGMLHLLEQLDDKEVICKSKSTRKAFALQVRQLYGYAREHAEELGIANTELSDLDQIFNKHVITSCARHGCKERKWTKDTVRMFIHRFHSVFKVLSPYSSQDWEWMLDLITEFRPEAESKKEQRLEARAFNYDYDSLETIPVQIRDERIAKLNLSHREREWMIMCEFLMLFLVTAPWPLHCLANCRVYSENANLFEKDGRWFYRFTALEVPFRRAATAPLPERLVPILRLYLKYRGNSPGPLFRTRRGLAFSSDRLSALIQDLTEHYVGERVPGSSFRDIYAYWWLLNHPGVNGYVSLARILWISDHACRLRYDKAYRDAYRKAHPEGARRRRKEERRREMTAAAA